MKLVVYVLLAAALIGLSFGICGCARKVAPNTVTLTTDDLITTRDAYKKAIERFEEKNPGWHIRHIEISGSNMYQKLLTMFAGNSDPDVLWLGQGMGVFAGKGLLADLNPLIAEDTEAKKLISEIHPNVLAAYKRENSLYGIPYGFDTQFLAYNKDLFDAAGVPYPHETWTREDLVQAAKKLTRRNDRGKVEVYGLLNAPHPFAFGVDFLTQDGKKVLLDSPQSRSYLQFLWDITNSRDPQTGQKTNISPDQDLEKTMGMNVLIAFATGRAAMTALEDYNIQDVRMYAAKGIHWDLALMPVMGDKERRTWASTAGFCISKRSKNKKMAFQMLKELASPEFMMEIYPQSLPANLKAMREAVLNDQKLRELQPNAPNVIIETTKYIRIAPRIAKFFELDNVWNEETSKFWAEDPSISKERQKAIIDDVVTTAAKNMQRLVDK